MKTPKVDYSKLPKIEPSDHTLWPVFTSFAKHEEISLHEEDKDEWIKFWNFFLCGVNALEQFIISKDNK